MDSGLSYRTKSNVRTTLPAMQLLDGMLQKILKTEELNRICYELGPMAVCSQCTKERLFFYITFESKNDSKGQKHDNTKKHISDCLQCSKCRNEVSIKCNSETDGVVKSKVCYLCSIFVNKLISSVLLEIQIWKTI